jgi:hypothetical protein
MGHDHHFLERLDRASRAETEFALSLYRDHEALEFVLESARLPPEAQRVALEIAEGGPHVIVQRDGHFVTCLGAGMSVGPHPVVKRGRIDGLLASMAALRARRKTAPLVQRPGHGVDELVARLIARSDSLSREEFVAISGWQPLLGEYFYHSAHQQVRTALSWVMEPLPRSGRRALARDVAKARWKTLWAVGHAWLLGTMGSRDFMADHLAHLEERGLTFPTAVRMLGSLKLSMRAWWGAARIGKPLVAVAKRRLARAEDHGDMLDAMMTLAVIGLRHAPLRAEVRKVLTTPRTFPRDHLDTDFRTFAAEFARIFDDGSGSIATST